MWSHHAYLLIGERTILVPELKKQAPSDWYLLEAENFGINDARELKRVQQQKAIGPLQLPQRGRAGAKVLPFGEDLGGAARRFLVVAFKTITPEAQNALLKTLEEPGPGNHFFLITDSTHSLLPTLLSRVQVVTTEIVTNKTLEKLAEQFLTANYEERLKLVGDYLAKEDKSAKAAALDLVNVLERQLRAGGVEKNATALKSILEVSSYLHDQAALPKLILEHLALTLPIF